MTGPGALVVAILLAAWVALHHVFSTYTWNHGPQTFTVLVLASALLLLGLRFARQLARLGEERLAAIVLSVALIGLIGRTAGGLADELARPVHTRHTIDIGLNTHRAGTLLLDGENPYSERAQAWHRIEPRPHVTVEGGRVELYGVEYRYGFPYFPALILTYLPLRPLAQGDDVLRITNGLLVLLNLVGIFWLASRSAPPRWGRVAGLMGCVAYLAIEPLIAEYFVLGVTDVAIATYAVFAYVAASHRRWLLAGVLFGIAQACKLLPGPLLIAPLLMWLWMRPGFGRLLAGYVIASVALVLPFVLWSPPHFLSSTILFYLTFHADGDSTSLWWFLSEEHRQPFRLLGLALSAGCVLWAGRLQRLGLAAPLTLSFVSYVIFIAFNNMTHLNYLWGVYTLGCAAVGVVATRLALGIGPPEAAAERS